MDLTAQHPLPATPAPKPAAAPPAHGTGSAAGAIDAASGAGAAAASGTGARRPGWHRLALDPAHLVALFTVSVLIFIWCAVGYEVKRDRADALDEWTRNLENLTRAFDEHTARTVTSVDQVVQFVRAQYVRNGTQTDLAELVREGAIYSAIYNQVGVIDAQGMYILSSLSFNPMYLGDREHFLVHARSPNSQIFISRPVLGRASGRWSMQFTRRITQPDGSFGGVVVASLDPQYFAGLYNDVDLGEQGVIALVGDDGITRARRSGGRFSLGQDISKSEMFTEFREQKVGHYIGQSRVDGRRRLYAFRRLADYPLGVMVGVPLERIYERSDERSKGYLLIGVAASALIIAFALQIITLLRRQKDTVAALEESRARAESANRLKSEFLASMSHELRTPLNGILGFADLLRHVATEPKARRYGETIHASGSHLLAVLNSILDIAKVEAGKMDVHRREEALRPLIGQVAQLHQMSAAAKQLTLTLRIDDNTPATFLCDAVLLRQVLNNLLSNAIKFTEQGGVTLALARGEQAGAAVLRFSVADTGIGIPAAAQALVFEKFRQADQSLTRAHQGTGLGLALSKQIVELMGGGIGLESVPGQGTEIHFTLPLTPAGRLSTQGLAAHTLQPK